MDYIKVIYQLFKKELLSYFNSPIAYIFIAVFLIVSNWLFFNSFFLMEQATLRPFFAMMPWIFLFLSPAITMRLWSEEKKTRTIEFLLTLPITNWQIVIAKFLSAIFFMIITLALTLVLPISVASIGNLDIGPVIGGYIGGVFLAGSYLSIGLFISSLTKNQIIAFVLGVSACFMAFIVGADFVLAKMPASMASVMSFIGLGSHFNSIAKGVIDSKDVIYYFSFILLFLWFNVQIIAKREWR